MRMRLFLALATVVWTACSPGAKPASGERSQPRDVNPPPSAPATTIRTQIGFRSKRQLDDHFAKHGREFGGISKQEYLRLAQQLRDRPVAGNVEEIVRTDGTASRFDRASGAFLAFTRDGTIRTFFKPNDGENYFRRQAQRNH